MSGELSGSYILKFWSVLATDIISARTAPSTCRCAQPHENVTIEMRWSCVALVDCATIVQGSISRHASERTELPPFRIQQVLNNPSPHSACKSS